MIVSDGQRRSLTSFLRRKKKVGEQLSFPAGSVASGQREFGKLKLKEGKREKERGKGRGKTREKGEGNRKNT